DFVSLIVQMWFLKKVIKSLLLQVIGTECLIPLWNIFTWKCLGNLEPYCSTLCVCVCVCVCVYTLNHHTTSLKPPFKLSSVETFYTFLSSSAGEGRARLCARAYVCVSVCVCVCLWVSTNLPC